MITQNTGRIRLSEYQTMGGKDFDSVHLSKFFRNDTPYNFGVKVAQLYSASDKFSYKPYMHLTEAQGRIFYTDNALYQWSIFADNYRLAEVIEYPDSDTNTRPGWNSEEFDIILSEPWYSRSEIISSDDPNVALEVLADPIEEGAGYRYTVRMESSRPSDFVDLELLQPGRHFRSVSSSIANEMNPDYPGIVFGSFINLESQIGSYSRSFTVTDRMITDELNAMERGDSVAKKDSMYAGYTDNIYDQKNKKVIKQGMFIPYAESLVGDQLAMDKEWALKWGQGATDRTDASGRYKKYRSPGWYELVKDGQTMQHNGNLNVDDFEDFFQSILINRNDESDRVMQLVTGTLGERLFDLLLSDAASGYLTSLDTSNDYFVRNMQGGRAGDLEYGFQFKRYSGKSGLIVELIKDPSLDRQDMDGRRYPYNQQYTIESATMNIMDFSYRRDSKSPDGSNMAIAKMKRQTEYYWEAGGPIDPRTGRITDGSQVANRNKRVGCFMSDTGGLIIWDTSSIGQIRLNMDNVVYAS